MSHDKAHIAIRNLHYRIAKKLISQYRNMSRCYWLQQNEAQRYRNRILHHIYALDRYDCFDSNDDYQSVFIDILNNIVCSKKTDKANISVYILKKILSSKDITSPIIDAANMAGIKICLPAIDINMDNLEIFRIIDPDNPPQAAVVNAIVSKNIIDNDVSDVINYVSTTSMFSDSWYKKIYYSLIESGKSSEYTGSNIKSLLCAGLTRNQDWANKEIIQIVSKNINDEYARLLSVFSVDNSEPILESYRNINRELALWYIALHGSVKSCNILLDDISENDIDICNSRAIEWIFGKNQLAKIIKLSDADSRIRYIRNIVEKMYSFHDKRIVSGKQISTEILNNKIKSYAGNANRDIRDIMKFIDYIHYSTATTPHKRPDNKRENHFHA